MHIPKDRLELPPEAEPARDFIESTSTTEATAIVGVSRRWPSYHAACPEGNVVRDWQPSLGCLR